MPMSREKTVDELMEEMERSAAALSSVPDPSEAIGAGVEAAIARHEKPMELPEMGFSGGTAVADQAAAAAPATTTEPPRAAEVADHSNPSAPVHGRAARPDVRRPEPAKPRRPGEPLDWSELVTRTKRGALVDDVVNSGNSMLAQMGPPGWQFRPNVSDSSEKLARLPLEMAKEQQAMESRQLAGDVQRSKLDATAASADPNSPQSQKAREAFKAFVGDTVPLPQGFDSWSAADVKSFADTGDLSLAERRKNLTEEARNRSKLSQLQLEALENERLRKAGFDEKKLEEDIRHHKATEKKPGMKGPPVKIEAGKLDTVPERRPGYRELVKGIAEGRVEAPKAAARFGAEIISDVLAYKPDFDATRFGAYKKVVEGQSTDKSKLAIDVAASHLEEAERLIPENYDPKMLNRVKNAFLTGSGAEDLSAFELAMLSSAHEIAKTFGIEDQTGKQAIEQMFDPTQSPQQLRARIAQARKLMAGKIEGFKRQRDAVAPLGSTPAATHGEPPRPADTVTVKDTKTGKTKTLPRDRAARYLADPRFVEVSGG